MASTLQDQDGFFDKPPLDAVTPTRIKHPFADPAGSAKMASPNRRTNDAFVTTSAPRPLIPFNMTLGERSR